MKKRLLSVLLSLTLIIAAIPVINIPAVAEDSGIFKISSVSDWQSFISKSDSIRNVELCADINIYTQYCSNTFCGTFNGNNHTITINLNAYRSSVGLFSSLDGAKIKNLCVNGSIRANGPVGGIAGVATNSYIVNCVNYAEVSCLDEGTYSRAGGIVGVNYGSDIINSENFGEVKGDKEIGGIVGRAEGGKLSNCYSGGKVIPVTEGTTVAGNVFGYAYYTYVSGCYYLSSLTKYNGYSEESEIDVKSWSASNGVEPFNSAVNTYGDPEISKWILYGGNPCLVIFVKVKPLTISTAAEYNDFAGRVNGGQIEYQLADVTLGADIGTQGDKITAAIGSETNKFMGTFNGNFHTVALSLNGQSNVGLFGFTDGATIKNVVVEGNVTGTDSVGGLIGSAYKTTVYGCCNYAYIKATGTSHAGGIAGLSDASTLESCINKGRIEGYVDSAGGIVGMLRNNSSVLDSVNEAEVTNDDYNTGGIVGAAWYSSDNRIVNCANYGKVTNNYQYHTGGIVGGLHGRSAVSNSINFADINGTNQNDVGGIVGFIEPDCSVTMCFNQGKVQTGVNHGPVVGYASNCKNYAVNYCKYIEGGASENGAASELYSDNALELTSALYNQYITENSLAKNGLKYWGKYYVNNEYAPVLEKISTCKHYLVYKGAVYPTETTHGCKDYYTCDICGISFTDSKGEYYIGGGDRLSLWKVSGGRLEKGAILYTDYENGEYRTKTVPSGYTALTNSSSWLSGGWYVVSNTVGISNLNINQNETVRLVLTDGCVLSVSNGLHIHPNASLYIYGQSTGAKAGKLNATGDKHSAGIGANAGNSSDPELGGSLIINGGFVEAWGSDDCAGIGGTYNYSITKNTRLNRVEINGGYVKAHGGKHGAGIGGGAFGDGENITVNGGTVYAYGGGYYSSGEGYGAAGIGGAFGGRAKNITINGGAVHAYASGLADRDESKNHHDGIGGSYGAGNSENIKVNGGVVEAKGAIHGSAINNPALTIADGYNIWGGGSAAGATLRQSPDNQIYMRLVPKAEGEITIKYVKGDNQSSVISEFVHLNAGELLQKPESISDGTVGYSDWYYDDGYFEQINYGEAFAVESATYYGKPHTHTLDSVPGKEPAENEHGYLPAKRCNHCGFYFEESSCEHLIGYENEYNEWKKSRGARVCYYDFGNDGKPVLRNTNFILGTFDEMIFEWGRDNAETWYYLDKDTTVYTRAVVKGTVHLILNDGATLKDDLGVTLEGNNTLIVHSCSLGQNMGTLKVSSDVNAAGIGGRLAGSVSGNLIINGGNIVASGYIPEDMQGRGGAGIGAAFGGKCGNITVNAGNVTATGGLFAAGIGGSMNSEGGNVTVNGGKVTAKATVYAAGIGGGMLSKGKFNIAINGGNVLAIGGGTGAALGLGDSLSDNAEYNITVNSELGFIAGKDMANMKPAKITAGTPFTEHFAVISNGSEIYTVKVYDENGAYNGSLSVPYGYPLEKEEINKLKLGYTVSECYRDKYLSEEWDFSTEYITSDTEIYVFWERNEDIFFKGDVNGDGKVNVSDCVLIRMYLDGQTEFAEIQLEAADVDGVPGVTADDAKYLAEYIVGLRDGLM